MRNESAEAWIVLDKVVFSTTLDTVQGSSRLATSGIAEEVSACANSRR